MAKRGAPKGNQNARKHGFYSKVLSDAESQNLQEAARIEGLDDEIALLRLKLRQLIAQHPENIQIQLKAANTLARLIRTRYDMTKEQKKSLKEAIARTLVEVAIPLGIKFIPK